VVIFSGKNPLPLIASANDMIQRPLILSLQRSRVRSSLISVFQLSLTLSPRSVSRLTTPSAARVLIKSENSRLFIFVLFPELPQDYPIFGKAEVFGIIVTLP
jgi:hypothetical protein